MHIFSIFGRLYHINSEIDMHIFSVSAVNITLIDIFLRTLLHLAGIFMKMKNYFDVKVLLTLPAGTAVGGSLLILPTFSTR